MVLYKYCPKCYSLNIGMDSASGGQKCRQCGFSGMMPQDSIDKINVMKRSKDGQRYAAATSSAKPSLRAGGPGNDCEVIRKRDDPYNDDIEEIEITEKEYIDDDDDKDVDDLESRQSNIMKRSSQQPIPQRHGLSPKSNLSAKERLKEKGGKDWDLV